MSDEAKQQIQVEVPDVPVKSADGSVEIDIESRPKEQVQKQQAARSDAEIKAWEAAQKLLAATQRHNEKLQREIAELRIKSTQPQSPPAPVATQDELDQLVSENKWKQAVDIIAEKRANAIFEQREQLRRQQEEAAASVQRLEKSKMQVVQKYPDLDPETGNADSPVAQAYTQVLNEHPEYLRNDYGPILAMRDMEERLNPAQPKKFAGPGGNYETIRRGRASAASIPQSRPLSGRNSVAIDRDEQEMLQYTGINPQQYARVKKALAGGNEEIEAAE